MILLAYIDTRPLIFIAGLPLFVGLALLLCRLIKANWGRGITILGSTLVYTGLFIIFLTGVGPFVDKKETRTYEMTWEIRPTASSDKKESEVVLSFVDFPGHHVGEYSDELAAHLRARGEEKVEAVFEVTTDYGKVRGFSCMEIAGLRGWLSEWAYAGTAGTPGGFPMGLTATTDH